MRIILLLVLCWPALVNAEISVVDDSGDTVRLPSPPYKIVSLSPHLTELLFSLGVGERIVATVDFSDYPEPAGKIPRLGNAFSVSVESVVDISPDLVVAWQTGGNRRTFEQLKALGYPVYINEAATLEGIASSVRSLGELVGQAARGQVLADDFLAGMAALREREARAARLDVFFQITDAQLYTVNNQHLIGQAISACGAHNVFGDVSMPVPMISFESLVERNPDVILVSSPYPGFESDWDRRWASLGWTSRVRQIDASLITRPSLRMLEGIKLLCRTLGEPG